MLERQSNRRLDTFEPDIRGGSLDIRSIYLNLLANRIDLTRVPFSERGSRVLVYQRADTFFIRLAERWAARDTHLEGYRTRPPLIDSLTLTDGTGNPLPISVTTYPHLLDIETPSGKFRAVFVDRESILVTIPEAPCGVSFVAGVDEGSTDRRGGLLKVTGKIRRTIAYTSNARYAENRQQAGESGGIRVDLRFPPGSERRALLLTIVPGFTLNRSIPPEHSALDEAELRWHSWFDAVPKVPPDLAATYYYSWWVLRNGLLSPRYYTSREVMTPSKAHYVGAWQWDCYFHALAYRRAFPSLAKDQLRIMLDHQRSDGMLPDAVHDEGVVTTLQHPIAGDVTKPPLVAWSAWKIYEMDGDKDFLDEIYEPLVRWNHWWFEKNDVDGNGLCEYRHPYSSGLDDSPLWDFGMPVESPDLNTYLYLQQEALARIAEAIGETEAAAQWAARADATANRMIDQLFDPDQGIFHARHEGRPLPCLTVFNLFPLITGRMPPDILAKLIGNLKDPEKFWTEWPVATVSRSDPAFQPDQMWRGPTWLNVNYLLIEGLLRSGEHAIAYELCDRTVRMVTQHHDTYEYYDSVSGSPGPHAAEIYGWSAAMFIELALLRTQLDQER